jgi:hypothetical protein
MQGNAARFKCITDIIRTRKSASDDTIRQVHGRIPYDILAATNPETSMRALLLAALCVASPALAEPACSIERAVYRLHGAPQFRAGFARERVATSIVSNLRFYLKTPRRIYWFGFESPNGYGGTFLFPQVDPAKETGDEPDGPALDDSVRDLTFDAFRADLSVWETPPASGDPAPAHLFARGLGAPLWYNPVDLANGDKSAEPETMPIAMFDLAECAPDVR